MPILETEIFGSKIEINYEKNEKERLEFLIEKLKSRISEFSYLKEKVTDKKILFLAALKAEDDNYDLNRKLSSQNENNKISKINTLEDLDNRIKEIISLKDKIIVLSKKNNELSNINEKAFTEIEKINNRLSMIVKKIFSTNYENN